jgi:signal transduction histidine kinase
MLQEKNTIITILTAFFICIILLLGLTKYLLPSFEQQIMLNIIEQSKRVSNHLIVKYNKDNNFLHMEEMKNDLNLEKIKFFDKSGKILYSSTKEDIGQINEKDYFHNIVVKGQIYYLIVKKGKETLENRKVQEDVAEVYIPIMKDGVFEYAFEVYYNITNQVKRFEELKLRINLISYLIAIIAFFSVVSWLYYSYKRKEKEIRLTEKLHSSRKMVAMGEMMENIAHQWRQPLSVISTGATGIKMQKELSVLTDKAFYETCDFINDNAQYLSRTIEDFKNFIKGDTETVKFRLTDNIETFLNIVHSSSKMEHLEIVLDLDDSLEIEGYPNELIQCYMNLFNNAKDALQDSKNKKYIFIETYQKQENIIIKFRDNGCGIPETIISRIFEPYFTTKHQSQGTGLGLSMTYNLIVDRMNGNIDVNNVSYLYEGKKYTGAEFTITLPMS